MAIGDLITTDWQLEYAGQLLGSGTNIELVTIDGLGLADVRTADVPRPRDHGLIRGGDFLGGRTVTIEMEVSGSSAAEMEESLRALQLLNTSIGLTEQPLVFMLPGQVKRRINARVRNRAVSVDIRYAVGPLASATVQFFSSDPRIYANAQSSANFSLPSSSGGLGWPLGWPVGWGSATSGAQICTNNGTFQTQPLVTFTGPLTAPSIQNVTSGETWRCTYDLQSGDTLVVDFDQRTVLLNGTASRYSYVSSSSVWWELAPGSSNVMIGANAGSGSASMTWYDAWA